MRLRKVTPNVPERKSKNRAKEAAASEPDNWEFFIIEVNPNPHLDKKGELAMAARKHGLNYSDLIEKIIELAVERNS